MPSPKRVVSLLTLLVVGACQGELENERDEAAQRAALDSDEAACQELASKSAQERLERGEDPKQVEARYATDVTFCASPDSEGCEAVVTGHFNMLNFQLTMAVLERTMTPSEYMHAMRYNEEKRRQALADESWCKALTVGDADGDFVPDDRDRCDTPLPALTDASGCRPSRAELAKKGSMSNEIGNAVLDGMGMLASVECEHAEAPETPSPLDIQVVNETWLKRNVSVSVAPVRNQPVDCVVFYEIDAVAKTSAVGEDSAPFYGHTTFRSTDSIGGAGTAEFLIESQMPVCPVGETCTRILRYTFDHQPPGRRQIANGAVSREYIDWRVRAVNGAGKASAWSAVTRSELSVLP